MYGLNIECSCVAQQMVVCLRILRIIKTGVKLAHPLWLQNSCIMKTLHWKQKYVLHFVTDTLEILPNLVRRKLT